MLLSRLGKIFSGLPLFFLAFLISCGLMLIISLYAVFIENFSEARVFFYTSLTGFLIFALVNLATSNRNLKESGTIQIISLILLFLFLPLFLAIPNWIILPNVSFTDVYFDMVSAITTTGLPVFNVDFLSKPLHLWRALIAWFGGGLIWIAAFAILIPASRGGFDVFSNKRVNTNRNLTINERSETLMKVSQKLTPIYVSLTIVLWCALTSLGTDGFTSLIRALSILSTSGISGPEKFETDGGGFLGEIVVALFLLLALSHNIFYNSDNKAKLKKILFDRELRLGLSIIICTSMLLFLPELYQITSLLEFNEAILSGFKLIWGNFFTVFSFITTNGYVSAYWNGAQSSLDTPHVVIITLGLCLFGGGLATTAGGIKLLRISILLTAFSDETDKLLHPSSIVGTKSKLKVFGISIFMAWIFFMLFLVSLALVITILTIFGMFFEDAIIVAVACLTTTGPIIEFLGFNSTLVKDLSNFSKIFLVVSMVIGRLEILVALSLITFASRRA
jgi:trk system potassium uptake protein TrkH